MERVIQSGSMTSMVHIASALRLNVTESMPQIEIAIRDGPKSPKRNGGKPKIKAKA